MRKFAQRLWIAFLVMFSLTAYADQIAVPTSDDLPARISVAPHVSTNFSSLSLLGGEISGTYLLGTGFEWGIGAKGGAESDRLFAGGDIHPFAGVDLMFRFLGGVTEVFHTGVQLDFGYTHFFSAARLAKAGRMLMFVSVPFSFAATDSFWFYVQPGVVLGEKKNEDYIEAARVWGGLYGLKAPIGFAVDLGASWLFVQATPRIRDWTDWRASFETDFAVGLGFNF